MRTRRIWKVAAGLTAGLCIAPSAASAATQLETEFGSGGVAAQSQAGGSFNSVALQDGPGGSRIVAVGGDEEENLVIARFLTDGTPDPSFGSGGQVVSDDAPAVDVAIKDDGGIYVVSGSRVLAFTPEGAVDAGFASGGARTIDGGRATLESIALDETGRIYVAGDTKRQSSPEARAVRRKARRTVQCPGYGVLLTSRLSGAGDLDASWGEDGITKIVAQDRAYVDHHELVVLPGSRAVTLVDYDTGCPLGGPSTRVIDYQDPDNPKLAYGGSFRSGDLIDAGDGKVLTQGRNYQGSLVTRFNPDLSEDQSFAKTQYQPQTSLQEIALTPGGAVVSVDADLGVRRFGSDGRLEASALSALPTGIDGFNVEEALSTPAGVLVAGSARSGGRDLQGLALVDESFGQADAPNLVIDSEPAETRRTTPAEFAFHSDTPGVQLECSVNDATFTPCSSPYTIDVPSEFDNPFSEQRDLAIRARDSEGRISTYAKSINFPSPPPHLRFTSFPADPVSVKGLLDNGLDATVTCGVTRCDIQGYMLVDFDEGEEIGLENFGGLPLTVVSLAPNETRTVHLGLDIPDLIPKMREAGKTSIQIAEKLLLCPGGRCTLASGGSRPYTLATATPEAPLEVIAENWRFPSSLGAMRRGGVKALTTCNVACSAEMTVTVSRATQRRFGLRSRRIGSGRSRLKADAPEVLRARLNASAFKAFSANPGKVVNYKARVSATAGDEYATATRVADTDSGG